MHIPRPLHDAVGHVAEQTQAYLAKIGATSQTLGSYIEDNSTLVISVVAVAAAYTAAQLKQILQQSRK